jgi:hypothetical protein
MKRYVIAVAIGLVLLQGVALADVWHFITVDSEGPVGEFTSIVVDSSGRPHISYYGGYDSALKYALRESDGWDIDMVDTGLLINSTDIAVDSNGYPHISYFVFGYGEVKYARWDGSSWQIEGVEYIDEMSGYTSIALDSSDNPHISYYSDLFIQGGELKYAYDDGTGWDIEVVDNNGTAGEHNSIELDSSDWPHISYYDSDNGNLMCAKGEVSGWNIGTVDTPGDVGTFTSITLDGYNRPHISYRDNTNNRLKYTHWNGTAWQTEVVDDDGDVGEYTSIALTPSGHPRISYYDVLNGDLKYAAWNGTDWDIETVDQGGDVGRYGALSLDQAGNPHISYRDDSNGDLKYAYFAANTPPSSFNLSQPPDGAEVIESVTLDWEDSTDDDGDTIIYDVWYATDPSFDPHDEVTELADSTYTFPEGVLSDDTTYYWKVRAWDGWDETWSGPDAYWSFTVDNELGVPVTAFSAESARNGIELTWECADAGVGFNLYRSEEATGMRTKSRDILNAELITGGSPYTYLDAEVSDGVTYSYWVEAIDASGASETFGPVSCTAGTFVPSSYALYQSRPNPARSTAVIAFDLPEDAEVTLTVYDLSGRKVTTLVNETLPAGAYERSISGFAPGVYVYRLEAGEFAAVRKMVVV